MRVVLPVVLIAGCASGSTGGSVDGGTTDDDGGAPVDGSCAELCDEDGDGVFDDDDACAGTPGGVDINDAGCSDDQVTPTLQDTWPPYGLTWTPTGELGRAGGLTWTYTGITRADLFHIYWIVCDDPATPCGLSLDGPIDVAAEAWQFSATDSSLAAGRLVFTNVTNILLADATTPQLYGRLTLQLYDDTNTTFGFADVATLGVTARAGTHGAEIDTPGFRVTAIAEVQDNTLVWTPYMDYYDAASTPDTGGGTAVSFGGSFYDE